MRQQTARLKLEGYLSNKPSNLGEHEHRMESTPIPKPDNEVLNDTYVYVRRGITAWFDSA